MQRRTEFGLRPAIAALTFAASAIALAPASYAAPAETCLGAPKGVAPQGSHWYYRIDRPSSRRCWYLAEKGQKVARRAATRPMPQAEPDEEVETTEAPATSVPDTPAANAPPVPAAEPRPVITTLVTRNVSNTEQIAQAQAPAAPDLMQPSAPQNVAPSTTATEAPEQAPSDQQASPAVADTPARQPAPAAAVESNAATSAIPALKLLLGAIALLGLLASVGLFVMAALRRRNDVLNRWRETAALPFEESPETAAEDSPAFRPMPEPDPVRQRDLDPIRQHDDVDEILHRLARRRRAA